jgi:mannose-1-phosphate guanylyltransferase / mannose-6-phosphate isomerase
MTKLTVQPVILCGGSGTRLWPLSRAGFPKQFLVLSGVTSLFQQAVQRLGLIECGDIELSQSLVVTNEEHRFLVLEQLRELQGVEATLLLEPVGRNTAPALTLAALQACESGEDPILVVTPADQTVRDDAAFKVALQQSVRAAAGGGIVILGITPDRPETGFGYIQQEGQAGGFGEYRVAKFAEKPSLDVARAYVEGGQHTWNSGMFVLRASTWLASLERFRPDILAATRAAWAVRSTDASFVRPGNDAFSEVPAESIDYAVMERCPGSDIPLNMVPLDAGWSDLGAWDAVWQVNQDGHQDEHGNVTHGDTMLADTKGALVHATSRLVATVGVDGLIIVETADAVLVADRARSQDIKKLVLQSQQNKWSELDAHRKVHRPWGWYDSIDEGERFKVKRIQVKPGASLSLQMHHHRAEHWVVVKGTAQITNGDKVLTLTENQSTYIPLGEVHRLANPGSIPLEIIEVQSGGYLGEDDIVRFEDTYGRTGDK